MAVFFEFYLEDGTMIDANLDQVAYVMHYPAKQGGDIIHFSNGERLPLSKDSLDSYREAVETQWASRFRQHAPAPGQ